MAEEGTSGAHAWGPLFRVLLYLFLGGALGALPGTAYFIASGAWRGQANDITIVGSAILTMLLIFGGCAVGSTLGLAAGVFAERRRNSRAERGPG